MKQKNWIILLLAVSFSMPAIAQRFPFPQEVKYEYGVTSQFVTSKNAKYEYEHWVNNYYQECSPTEARIVTDGKTVSEGIGYGMLITAYMGDKDKFQRIWNFYKKHKNENGVMHWQTTNCDSVSGKNGATDAEMDAAMALVVAIAQWPDDAALRDDVKVLLLDMHKHEFTVCPDGVIAQKPGDYWGGCTCTNPSYFAPGYYRAFSKFWAAENNKEESQFWIKAADGAYYTLNRNAHPKTGLFWAWTSKDGVTKADCIPYVDGAGGPADFQYDACRVPWRITVDYLWWGTSDAKSLLNRIITFVKAPATDHGGWYGAGGHENIVDGYRQNGVAYGQWHNVPFVGAFSLTAMASTQKDADEFMEHFKNMNGDNYYNSCLAVMFKLLASGNFWNPYNSKK